MEIERKFGLNVKIVRKIEPGQKLYGSRGKIMRHPLLKFFFVSLKLLFLTHEKTSGQGRIADVRAIFELLLLEP